MKRVALTLAAVTLVSVVSSCSGGSGDGASTAAADSLTRRPKDSIISTLPIPGAGAVGRALQAADSAAARAAAHDSLLGGGP